MAKRVVTLQDFIMPEFRGCDPNDYEFRSDGKIVRKDRWETGIYAIQSELIDRGLMHSDDFEIQEIIDVLKQVLPMMPGNEGK
mgnify:CR=1 FL=1